MTSFFFHILQSFYYEGVSFFSLHYFSYSLPICLGICNFNLLVERGYFLHPLVWKAYIQSTAPFRVFAAILNFISFILIIYLCLYCIKTSRMLVRLHTYICPHFLIAIHNIFKFGMWIKTRDFLNVL